MVIVLGVTVVMSLTAASYFVLTKFSPEGEIRRMTLSMSRLQTLTQHAGFHWTAKDQGADVYTTLFASGPMRLSNPSQLEHDTSFRSVFLSKANKYQDVSGEIKSKDGNIFLTYTPPGPIIEGADFSQSGTWVSFAPGEFPSWGSIIPELKLPFPFFSSHTAWTPDSLKKLRILLSVADVLSVKYHGVEEKISGVETRVIDAHFDTDALKSFLFDVIRVREGRDPTDAERINVATAAADLEHLSVRLWIGKKDHLLYRIQAVGGLPIEHTTELSSVDARIDFSEFNKPFELVAPTNVIPFASIFESLARAFPMSTTVFGRVNTIPTITQNVRVPSQTIAEANDTDRDGLDNTLELFFGTNPNVSDTDKDGISDGEEVRRGTNPRGRGSLFGFGLGR